MLTVCTWLWGDKYSAADVNRLWRALGKHFAQGFRFVVLTESERSEVFDFGIERYDIQDRHLLEHKGCFVRLRMFDPDWQKSISLQERLVCLDLDVVITGQLDPLFDRPERFVILGGANSVNPCPYNGSVMMLRPRFNAIVWQMFSVEAAAKMRYHEFPDDQGWIAHMLPYEATWPAGRKSGIYGFKKPGWPPGTLDLPPGTRMVVFPGARQPRDYTHLNWVRRHWEWV